MNNQSPLIPQGSFLDQKNRGRARVKIAVFVVLAVHGVALVALLMQGCGRPKESTLAETNQPPQLDQQNNMAPTFQAPTNSPQQIPETSPPPVEATNTPPALEQAPASNSVANPPPQAPSGGATDYKIAKGDTFARLARKFHVPVSAILNANPGVNPRRLKVGETVHIPAPAAAETSASNAPAPGQAMESPGGARVYTVKSGDTLSRIAHRFGATVRALRAANHLRTDRIRVGQKLVLPKGSSNPQSSEPAPASPPPQQ